MVYSKSRISYAHLLDILEKKRVSPSKLNKRLRDINGTNEQILDRIKHGRDIRISTAVCICNVLGITLDTLMGRDDGSGIGGVQGDGNLTTVNGDVNGDGNVISVSHASALELSAENKALRVIIEELRAQRDSYAKTIEHLSKWLGRISDQNLSENK